MTGCLSAKATGNSCEAGSIGAIIGEMWGDYQVDNPNTLSPDQQDTIINQAKLIAGITAAFAGEDVTVAASVAAEAVRWNSTRRANRTNLTQQQRNDIVHAQIRAIQKYLPSFNGFGRVTRRGDSNYSQAELNEYIAFRRFIETTPQTFPNQHNAEMAFRQWQRSPSYSDPFADLNIGRNNANFVVGRHNIINIRDIQQIRINQIKRDFNSSNIHPKDMTVTINGNTYYTNPRTSDRAPVYQGVSNQDVQTYYMQIAGIQNMPSPRPISGRQDIYGNPAQVWVIKPTQGPLIGATINLRTYSNTQMQSRAKYTIEIIGARNTQSGIKSNRIEIKFEE